MTVLSACFTGPRAGKMPYDDKSAGYEKLKKALKAEIIRLIREGVSEFYSGGQTGVDTLAALLVLKIRDEIGTTARLHLVLPYGNMCMEFSRAQKNDFFMILKNADTIKCLSKKYVPGCYRERNRYMVERSDYLIAMAGGPKPHSGTHMTIGMAKRKGIEIVIIDPLKLKITRYKGNCTLLK